ncbi:MAG: FISUMP domain-containing protein [Bacteroidales bacterium]|jgi:uncharacterized protein (TIGR02145 family)
MRNLIKTLSVVLIITAINACTLQEAPDPPTGGGAITITAQTVQEQDVTNVPGTKTTLSGDEGLETHWVAGADKIGIFSPQARTTGGGETPIKNAEFTAQTSAKSSNFTGTMFWGADGNHDFYAYYPRNPEFTGERTVVPVSLASAQSQSEGGNSAHIGALDYMVATPLTVASGGAVSLTFNHVFVMIEFQITGSDSGSLSAVRLSGDDSDNPLACAGTIDLTQSAPAPGSPYSITRTSTSKYVTVTLGTAAPLSLETATSVYMMILPGAQSENLQIALKIGDTWKEMSKTQPEGGFVRGKKYLVTLNTAYAGWNAAIQDSRDSQIYQYKTIGTQVWMTENLAYLPSVVGPGTGSNSTAYYYVYGYNGTDVATAKATSNYTTYGVLYNWPAAMNGSASSISNPSGVQGICPSGWHLPSDAEWKQLEKSLGMTDAQANSINFRGTHNEGNKLKEAGTVHWNSPNTGATNETGFTALPGGYRAESNIFSILGETGNWWSSTFYNSDNAYYRSMSYVQSGVYRSDEGKNEYGLSVRCVRN